MLRDERDDRREGVGFEAVERRAVVGIVDVDASRMVKRAAEDCVFGASQPLRLERSDVPPRLVVVLDRRAQTPRRAAALGGVNVEDAQQVVVTRRQQPAAAGREARGRDGESVLNDRERLGLLTARTKGAYVPEGDGAVGWQ